MASWRLSSSPRRSDSPVIAVEEDDHLRTTGADAEHDPADASELAELLEVEENITIEDELMSVGGLGLSGSERHSDPLKPKGTRQPKSARAKPLTSHIAVPSAKAALSGSLPANASPEKRRMVSSQMATLPSSPLGSDAHAEHNAQPLKRPFWKRHAPLGSPRDLAPGARTAAGSSMNALPHSPPTGSRAPLAGSGGQIGSPLRGQVWTSTSSDVMCVRPAHTGARTWRPHLPPTAALAPRVPLARALLSRRAPREPAARRARRARA